MGIGKVNGNTAKTSIYTYDSSLKNHLIKIITQKDHSYRQDVFRYDASFNSHYIKISKTII